MSLPSWTTNADLGTKPSGSTDTITFTASADTSRIVLLDSDIPGNFFSLGNTASIELSGHSVLTNTTYSVSLRAINSTGITDKNFTLTILASTLDPWDGVSSSLGNWELGVQDETQFSAVWLNELEYVISQGTLPRGLYLDSHGILFGIPGSDLFATSLDATTWFLNKPADLITTGTYTFTVRARDMTNKNVYFDKTFTLNTIVPLSTPSIIFLMPNNSIATLGRLLTASIGDAASSNQIRAAFNFIPNYLNPSSNSLGSFRHNNVLIEQIKTWDPLGGLIEYELIDTAPGDPPPQFLSIDRFNGYVNGQLPNISFVDQTFNVTVQMTRMISGSPVTQVETFTITVQGLTGNRVEFLDVDGNVLDSSKIYTYKLKQGEDSTLAIKAQWLGNSNQLLFYNLAGGYLPPGVSLSSRGLLAGRVSWNATLGEYNFTVSAYDPTLRIPDLAPLNLQTQNFQIQVEPNIVENVRVTAAYDAYYRAFLPIDQRIIWRNLVSDPVLFNESTIYRPEDLTYGRKMECEFLAFPALKEYEMEQFVTAVSQNWQAKRFRFGRFHTAKMTDRNGNYIADAVYVDIKDNLVNSKGNSPSQLVTNSITGNTLYPPTLINQLDRMIAEPGIASDSLLPQWMTSLQDDGRPLGFVPAAVLCYMTPGNGVKTVRKLINLGISLNTIDFHIDRILIKQVPITIDPTSFDSETTIFDSLQTTFDVDNLGDKYIYFNTDGAIYDIIN